MGVPGDEVFEVVDETGKPVGQASRRECHSNPALMHQAVHVLVFDDEGRLFLQKRSRKKDIQPGRWDTSVGGHMQPGENPEQAALREMQEELGIAPAKLDFLYQYTWRSSVETELVRTFKTVYEGPFRICAEEIETARYWTTDEIKASLGRGVFTPNFEFEFRRFNQGK